MLPSPVAPPADLIGTSTRDLLAPFRNAILAVRTAATLATIALSAPAYIEGDVAIVILSAVVVGYSVLRIMYPLSFRPGRWRSHVPFGVEIAFTLIVVLTTGAWDSPFIFAFSSSIVVTAFARGFAIAVRVSLLTAAIVTAVYLLSPDGLEATRFRAAGQWILWLLLLSFVAGYARRATSEAIRQHTVAIDPLYRLADANRLLHSLHEVTQTLPASLDLENVILDGSDHLTSLLEPDGFALLLLDDSDGSFDVVRRDGPTIPTRWADDELPEPLREILRSEDILVSTADHHESVFDGMHSGFYAPLRARDEVVGLVVAESRRRDGFADHDRGVVRTYLEPFALALDNARWFSRLRTVGADEERTRIARDLHDRVGQSLAYLAFELDRVITLGDRGEPLQDVLENFRGDLRMILGEMREALYDLRTDITESSDPVGMLELFMERVADRSGLETVVGVEIDERLPPLRERELWRITQEAVTNAERHARASRIEIRWRTWHNRAFIEIIDDGVGLDTTGPGRIDSYGIRGMRERAASIGASLAVRAGPTGGTVVTCTIGRDASGAVTE